jgi:hypothetical protein
LLTQEKGEKALLHASCTAFRSACMVCQARRNRHLDEDDVLLSQIPTAPWGEISVDTLLIQPVDAEGNTHIVVVTDNFTKWTRLEPVQADDAVSVAKAVLRATLSNMVLLSTSIRALVFLAGGLFLADRIIGALLLLPFALGGLWAGHRIQLQVSRESLLKIISVMLLLIGTSLIVRVLR